MASSLSLEWRGWITNLRERPRLALSAFILAVVAVLLFKLALSAGGRDATAWSAFQLATLGGLALLVLAGSVRHTALTGPLLGVVAAIVITSLGSVRPQSSLDQVLAWVTYVAIFVVVASTIRSTDTARRLVDFLVAVGGWLCLVGLYLFWGADNPMMRWYSTFYWPNPFAGFLLLVLPLELVRFVQARSPRQTLTHGMMSLLLGVPLVLTFSRGAWMAAGATAVLGVSVSAPAVRRQLVVRGLVFVSAVALAVALLTQGQAFQSEAASVLARAASISDASEYSFQGRLHFWRGALEIFRDHPVKGTGPGTYGFVYPQYQRDARFYSRDPHNVYLQAAAESGVVGLAAWSIVLTTAASIWIRALRRLRHREEFPIIAGLGMGLLAFFLHSGVEMNWSFPAGPAAALALLGVLAWYDASDREMTSVRPRRGAVKFLVLLPVIAAALAVVAGMLAETAFRQGREEFDRSEFAEAERTLRRGSSFSPLDPRFPSGIADVLRRRGASSAEVRRFVEHAIALDRMNPYYRIQLGSVLRSLERAPDRPADELEAALRAALALDPYHYPEAYQQLIQLYLDRGDSASAARVFESAMRRYAGDVAGDFVLRPLLWPRVARLFIAWGEVLTAQGHYEEGIAMFRHVLESDPLVAEAYLALSRIYVRMGRFVEADTTLRQGMDRIPQQDALWIAWRTLPQQRSLIWEQ